MTKDFFTQRLLNLDTFDQFKFNKNSLTI